MISDLGERVSEISKEKNLTVAELERNVGLGNGVIRRWGISSPRIDNVIKVANCLRVSLDYLVTGHESPYAAHVSDPAPAAPTPAPESTLTSDETQLLDFFRSLRPEEREKAVNSFYTYMQAYMLGRADERRESTRPEQAARSGQSEEEIVEEARELIRLKS